MNKVAHSFQRALLTYDDHATIQRQIAIKLMSLFLAARESDGVLGHDVCRVLELGCGTGFLTREVLKNYKVRSLFLNDVVAECEGIIREKFEKRTFDFIEGDLESVELPAGCELICGSSVVQWVEDSSLLVEKLATKLQSKGWLAISSFSPSHFMEINKVLDTLSEASPAEIDDAPSMAYLDETQWRELLSASYDVKTIEQEQQTIWFDSVEDVLQHLRKTGVNGRSQQQWSVQKHKQFVACYTELFEKEGRLPLTYNPIYVVARKNS